MITQVWTKHPTTTWKRCPDNKNQPTLEEELTPNTLVCASATASVSSWRQQMLVGTAHRNHQNERSARPHAEMRKCALAFSTRRRIVDIGRHRFMTNPAPFAQRATLRHLGGPNRPNSHAFIWSDLMARWGCIMMMMMIRMWSGHKMTRGLFPSSRLEYVSKLKAEL